MTAESGSTASQRHFRFLQRDVVVQRVVAVGGSAGRLEVAWREILLFAVTAVGGEQARVSDARRTRFRSTALFGEWRQVGGLAECGSVVVYERERRIRERRKRRERKNNKNSSKNKKERKQRRIYGTRQNLLRADSNKHPGQKTTAGKAPT